MTRNINWI